MATNKDKLIAAAQKLVEKGSFEKAIKEYLKVVAEDQADVRIWLKIGDLYFKLGKRPEAAETYQRVAQFYSDQGFYLKSVAVYKQILKLDPRLVEVNQRLAELYKQLGLLSDAMQQYEAVAAFFHREGKTREALAALKQIVELDPETVANRIKLAELYSKEQMPREAIDEFTRAAEQLREAGRIDDFMKVAERLLFHSPDNRPVTKELAGLYIEKGDPRRALPKLQVLFKANPRDTDVLGLLARAFEALEQRPKAVSVYKELARILGENGDTRGREEIYRKIATLAPGDPDADAALKGRPRTTTQPPSESTSGARTSASGARAAKKGSARHAAVVAPPAAGGEGGKLPTGRKEAGGAEVEAEAPAPALLAEERGREAPVGQAEEEIAKILNETDVYIKYNLHAKAIEHVQRAFERNPKHVEAREKLKALYLIVGKRDEAVLELWALAEHAEPGRQRRYLREILELDPHNVRAADLLGEKVEATQREIPEEVVEIGEEDFDIAPPSGLGSALPSTQARVEGSAPRFTEPPHREGSRGKGPPYGENGEIGEELLDEADDDELLDPSEEEDLIPLVVEPVTDSSSAISYDIGQSEPDEAGDRFSLEETTDLKPMTSFESEALATPGRPTLAPLVPSAVPSAPAEARTEASLEDDLDEADFFIQQCLFEEARTMLFGLLERHPNHPLVNAKLRELTEAEDAITGRSESLPVEIGGAPISTVTTDLSAELPTDLPGSVEAGPAGAPLAPKAEPVLELTRRGVIEKGVNAEDFETHYDLGIAYKEMGLIDDAIAEFRIVLKDSAREVQCHLMIGLCFMEKTMLTDAIGQFKKGLYVEGITDRESLSLYFELGQAYEKLSDPREALYYYDKVQKRDARFREVEKRILTLRGHDGAAVAAGGGGSNDDVDAAFETLLGEDAS